MKTAFFVLASVSAFALTAAAESNYQIKVDWKKPGTLKDTVVQQCDDTYYPAVEIVIPGKPGKQFLVEMNVDVTSGKLSAGCSIKREVNADSTTYTVDADNGGCSIQVYKVRKDFQDEPQSASYEISDAC